MKSDHEKMLSSMVRFHGPWCKPTLSFINYEESGYMLNLDILTISYWSHVLCLGTSPPLASNGPGPRPSAGAFPGTASQPPVHPPPIAGPHPPDLGQFRASSSFLLPFPPQQAKVRKKHAHLQIPRRHVWKRNTQPAGQVWCVAGACLGVTIEWTTVGSTWKPGPH